METKKHNIDWVAYLLILPPIILLPNFSSQIAPDQNWVLIKLLLGFVGGIMGMGLYYLTKKP